MVRIIVTIAILVQMNTYSSSWSVIKASHKPFTSGQYQFYEIKREEKYSHSTMVSHIWPLIAQKLLSGSGENGKRIKRCQDTCPPKSQARKTIETKHNRQWWEKKEEKKKKELEQREAGPVWKKSNRIGISEMIAERIRGKKVSLLPLMLVVGPTATSHHTPPLNLDCRTGAIF